MKKFIKLLVIITIISISVILYANKLGTKGLRVNEIKVSSNIIDDFYGFKIVQISDLNYRSDSDVEELETLITTINSTKPNIIVFTGNMLNTTDENKINELKDNLNNLEAINGKYAISGNTDLNYDYDVFLNDINFVNIDNTYKKIYNNSNKYILISGISSIEDNSKKENINIEEILLDDNLAYNILLIHEPDIINDINIENYNLILAGHTLGGLIKLPFTNGLFKQGNDSTYNKDYYKITSTDIYISSGLGCLEYNYRLFNKPSFNLYRLAK